MSHTYTWTDPETGFQIYVHHNGDMSGEALIVAVPELCQAKLPGDGTVEVTLPAKFLVAFARNATVHDAIEKLEELIV